jgi:3-oxoacyl-[acyl-carrier-protein] synthase-1
MNTLKPLHLEAYTLTSALGRGIPATLAKLQESRSGLQPCDYPDTPLKTWIGRVHDLESVTLPPDLAQFDCRSNRLTHLALLQDGFTDAIAAARDRFHPTRIGVFIGTTTSGIQETEQFYKTRLSQTDNLATDFRYRYTHNGFSCTDYVRRFLKLQGPAQTVMTACSSSAKTFAVAHRHMAAGLCDAAVVGGVDSLCLTTLYGFNALQLVSSHPCRPWDAQRDGLSIGEAAGFALLRPAQPHQQGVALLGYGESMDAYHMSAPHPQGQGAALAMAKALRCANLSPEHIDYINLHGTATPANDASEDKAVVSVFGRSTPCSSSKGWTGHTLGAAGISEAIVACLSIEQGFLPASLNTETLDPSLMAPILLQNQSAEVRRVMSNSLGFGGNNCALIFGKLP